MKSDAHGIGLILAGLFFVAVSLVAMDHISYRTMIAGGVYFVCVGICICLFERIPAEKRNSFLSCEVGLLSVLQLVLFIIAVSAKGKGDISLRGFVEGLMISFSFLGYFVYRRYLLLSRYNKQESACVSSNP